MPATPRVISVRQRNRDQTARVVGRVRLGGATAFDGHAADRACSRGRGVDRTAHGARSVAHQESGTVLLEAVEDPKPHPGGRHRRCEVRGAG